MNEQILCRLKTGGESIEEMQYLCTEVAPKEIEQLTARVRELESEVAHWRNNHETEVRRARILKERTDMPIDRVQAYEKWGEDQARVCELELNRDELAKALSLAIDCWECEAFLTDEVVNISRVALSVFEG